MKELIKVILLAVMFGGLLSSPISAEEEDNENRTVSETLTKDNEETEKESSNQKQTEEAEFTDKDDSGVELTDDRSMFSILLQLFAALALVIGIMYILLKFLHKRTRQFQSNQTLQNLGGVPLGQNKSVQIVKVGERLLVVGVGESIQLLKEIDSEKEMEQFIEKEKQLTMPSWNGTGESFFKKMKNLTGPLEKTKHSSEAKQQEFQAVFEQQLHEMKKTRELARQHLKEFD